jgi:glyoxylate reductase
MMNILVTGNLPEDLLAPISQVHTLSVHRHDHPMAYADIASAIGDKDGLLCMITDRVDRHLLDKAPRLKVIANFGVGYNNIDVAEASKRHIMVTNTPDVLTDATADLTFALILSVGRRVVHGDRHTRQGKFRYWAPFHFLGAEITGKTLGIIGMGRIGAAVAKRAAGFDMPVRYHNRRRLPSETERALGVDYADMETLLSRADFVSLHVPLTQGTRHLIGADQLAMMKPEAFLINTARGPVVDELALLSALQNKVIAGAGLDVYENEPTLTAGLTALENVVLLPHMGSATEETRRAMGAIAVENIAAGLEGRQPPHCVNCH